MSDVPKVFSPTTLEKFEKASASIPLRQLDRAFEAAAIRPGTDPGGPEGARRVQFRRYIAGVNQHDPQQLDRLGAALGALIAEVAASKVDFLVQAAERDGFAFADSVFAPAVTAPHAFAVYRIEDFASIDDRGRRLYLLADERPNDAIDGATELVDSVCRTVLRQRGKAAPKNTADLADLVDAMLKALGFVAASADVGANEADVGHRSLRHLGGVVASVTALRRGDAPTTARTRKRKDKVCSPRYARLAVGAAVTFASFIAETYTEHDGNLA